MIRKILVIDDSATAVALFKACMKGYPDYIVLGSNNWQKGIELAEKEKPFLIILDYNMPEKTGPEIATIMQKKGIDAKLVLMSANTQNSVIKEIEALGFIDVLEKPVTAESVQTLLEKIT